MSERYLVRCTDVVGRAMAGIYAAALTSTGMVATWKQDRAARYESEAAANAVASRLGKKYSGTVWSAEVVQ